MSDCEFLHFFSFSFQSFSLCYVDFVIVFRNFEGEIYPFGIVFLFGWALKTSFFIVTVVFYDNSFVFGSIGFDPKFVAFDAAG